MFRLGTAFIFSIVLLSCHSGSTENKVSAKQGEEGSSGFDFASFADKFKTKAVPYELPDSVLISNEDTSRISAATMKLYIPDSLTNKIFGKEAKPKYTAMAKFAVPKGETYCLVKATAGSHKAAILLAFNKDKEFGAAFPMLVIDSDPTTIQTSSIDKSFTVYRNISRKQQDGTISEGKDVYAYSKEPKRFTLIMTDLLDKAKTDLINPIDTFPRKNKFAGDYIVSKTDIVSVRDGRRPNEIRVFAHFERDKGECTGELKGDAIWVSSNMALYRQGGDPCVLEFHFTPTTVTLKEKEGCGIHRGVRCQFEGTYPKKKEPKPKSSSKKLRNKS